MQHASETKQSAASSIWLTQCQPSSLMTWEEMFQWHHSAV